MSATRSGGPKARATDILATLILATRGIAGGPGSAARHARAIGRRSGWGQVRIGCLKALLEERPLPAEAVAALPGGRAIAVGLFLDDGPHGDADVRLALRAAEKPIAYSGAIGADAGLVPLILAQAAVQ